MSLPIGGGNDLTLEFNWKDGRYALNDTIVWSEYQFQKGPIRAKLNVAHTVWGKQNDRHKKLINSNICIQYMHLSFI